jgi:hypothetical protein
MLRNCGFCFQNKTFELCTTSHDLINKLGTSRSKYTGGPRFLDIRLSYNPRFRTLEILVPNPSLVHRIRTFVHSWQAFRATAQRRCQTDFRNVFCVHKTPKRPIPVAAWSKVWVFGRWLAGIASSNPAGRMDVCLLSVLCVVRYRSLRRADHRSRGVLSSPENEEA